MSFVDHNIAEVCQKASELLVHRQQALVQHVRISDQHLSSRPDLPPVLLHCRQRLYFDIGESYQQVHCLSLSLVSI